jgi:hypothetical protein
MKVVVIQFSPASDDFISVGSKYSLQAPSVHVPLLMAESGKSMQSCRQNYNSVYLNLCVCIQQTVGCELNDIKH